LNTSGGAPRLAVPSEAARIEADRQVADQAQLVTRRRQLAVEQPLQPGMEGDAVSQPSPLPAHGMALRVAQLLRPRPPAGPVQLAQGGEEGPAPQVGPRCGRRPVCRRPAPGAFGRGGPPQSLERRQLVAPNLRSDDRG
jgi:hypothetical protein